MDGNGTAIRSVHAVSLPVWNHLLVPVRAEIIEAMRSLGAATIKEVAGALGRVPSSLYAHFDVLVSLQVLVEREPRRLMRHTERVFELAASDFVPDFRGASDEAIGEIAMTTMHGATRSAVRTLRAAARARQLRIGPDKANHGLMHEVVWLNEDELAELREALQEIKQLCGRRKMPEGRRPHLLIAMHMPIVGSSRSHKGTTDRSKKAADQCPSAKRTRRAQ